MRFTLGQHPELNKELNALQQVYESLGVEVDRYPSETCDAVFHRDVAAWTPRGLIKANMGKKSRRWEVDVWMKATGIRPDCAKRRWTPRLRGNNRFEGADLLWQTPTEAYVSWGSRTSGQTAQIVKTWLESQGVHATLVALPHWHDQHLLGVANCISGLLFHYADVDNDRLRGIELPKGEYHLKGSNWVQVGQHVVINEDCKETIRMIEKHCSVMPVNIKGLLYHGGGVACATGIIDYVIQPSRT